MKTIPIITVNLSPMTIIKEKRPSKGCRVLVTKDLTGGEGAGSAYQRSGEAS
jgi:hypothetical protein